MGDTMMVMWNKKNESPSSSWHNRMDNTLEGLIFDVELRVSGSPVYNFADTENNRRNYEKIKLRLLAYVRRNTPSEIGNNTFSWFVSRFRFAKKSCIVIDSDKVTNASVASSCLAMDEVFD